MAITDGVDQKLKDEMGLGLGHLDRGNGPEEAGNRGDDEPNSLGLEGVNPFLADSDLDSMEPDSLDEGARE